MTKIYCCFKLSRDSCDIKHTVLRLRALEFSISVIQLSFNSPVTGYFFRTLNQGNEVSAGETMRDLTVNSVHIAIVQSEKTTMVGNHIPRRVILE